MRGCATRWAAHFKKYLASADHIDPAATAPASAVARCRGALPWRTLFRPTPTLLRRALSRRSLPLPTLLPPPLVSLTLPRRALVWRARPWPTLLRRVLAWLSLSVDYAVPENKQLPEEINESVVGESIVLNLPMSPLLPRVRKLRKIVAAVDAYLDAVIDARLVEAPPGGGSTRATRARLHQGEA